MANGMSTEVIASRIFEVRGKRVMFDRDLAELYGVTTFNLNKAVKRNIERFPEDFMFQLSYKEYRNLIFHSGISSWGGIRKLPYVFTEQGVAMLSGVLRSKRAVRVNIQIMRAFVQMRRMLLTNADLRRKINALERKYDRQFSIVFEAIRKLLEPPKQTRAVGFEVDAE